MIKLKNVNELKTTKMTKERLLKLYIADITNLVKDSDARDNRLSMLEDELEKEQEQVNVALGSVSNCLEFKGDRLITSYCSDCGDHFMEHL